MNLKILGTHSPNAAKGHNAPGYLVTDGTDTILLDCGSGCSSLLSIPEDLINLNIFISHLHWDHFNDTPILQYAAFANSNLGLIKEPIKIWIPASPIDKHELITNEKDSFATFHTINEDTNIKIGKMTVSFCKTDHPIETYAIKVTDGKQTIVYTADTSFSAKDKLVKFAKDCDILLSESSLLKEHGFPEICSHLTAEQAGIIAKEANVKKLVLTHFWPTESIQKYFLEAKKIFENVHIAN